MFSRLSFAKWSNRSVVNSEGERLTDKEMDMILKVTETKADNDGNIKYEGAPVPSFSHYSLPIAFDAVEQLTAQLVEQYTDNGVWVLCGTIQYGTFAIWTSSQLADFIKKVMAGPSDKDKD